MPRLAKPLAPGRGTLAAVIWFLAALSLLSVAVIRGSRAQLVASARTAASPLSRTNPSAAHWWAFLAHAEQRLPQGSTAAIYAADPETSMTGFMLALGALPDHALRPYWYFGVEHRDSLTHSEFLLSYHCAQPANFHRPEVLMRDRAGCVFKLEQEEP